MRPADLRVGDLVWHTNLGRATTYRIVSIHPVYADGVIVAYHAGSLTIMERGSHGILRQWHAARHLVNFVYPDAVRLPEGL